MMDTVLLLRTIPWRISRFLIHIDLSWREINLELTSKKMIITFKVSSKVIGAHARAA